MKTHYISFSGEVLERGFWLYVWRITHKNGVLYYVGRTGDSSSKFAASPFSRLGQHLDVRESASANMLMRKLRTAKVNPLECTFEMISVGPLFPEQGNLIEHRQYRDIIAPLETALAEHLKSKNFSVIGSHPKPRPFDTKLFADVKAKIDKALSHKGIR